MSSKQALIAKIKEHKDQLEKAKQDKENQHLRFSDAVKPLYSHLHNLLSDIDGVITSEHSADLFISDVNAPSFQISMLGRKVEFLPSEVSGVRGIRVLGLYDRELFFRPSPDAKWEADDERSGNVIRFSETILFERLIALVPSEPTDK